ncbi:MAG: hypothetical protein ACT4O0_09785 [Pseudonocardia sp.]
MYAHDADEIAHRAARHVSRLFDRPGLNGLVALARAESDNRPASRRRRPPTAFRIRVDRVEPDTAEPEGPPC